MNVPRIVGRFGTHDFKTSKRCRFCSENGHTFEGFFYREEGYAKAPHFTFSTRVDVIACPECFEVLSKEDENAKPLWLVYHMLT